jgi:cellulose synthase/poly-beta-1,6-N-acetylglucosamine synthase-like glycosyltransferase
MKVMVVAIILAALGIIDLAVFLRLRRAFRLTRLQNVDEQLRDLPTVSICISARNETHAMTQCLERVVATDYPKLEVIVLDDGSRDDTSVLIKSFAHAGVRFVEGMPLPDGWLGKNYAQSLLAREASGKLLFFMDVDTLVDRHTVARAVAVMAAREDKMLSIIPLRESRFRLDLLFTTMRHFWLLMRHSPKHPRATANAWLVERELLLDEFAHNDTLPLSMKVESAVASKLAQKNAYRLVLGNKWMGLAYQKEWSAQLETSIRILYLQCHKRWYEAAGLVLILLFALVPYVAWIISPWALALVVLHYLIALYYLYRVWPRYFVVGALVLPITIIQEIVLLVVSAYKYHQGSVTWKGRPIVR